MKRTQTKKTNENEAPATKDTDSNLQADWMELIGRSAERGIEISH